MKFAYADPPYFGYAGYYKGLHAESAAYDDLTTHARLIERLCDEFPEAWALSMTSGNLHDILPLCPKAARIGSWVKPFASFKPGVNPAYAWEPIVFYGGRQKRARDEPTVRDWVACQITLKRGFVGAKPRKVCRWIFEFLGARPGDDFTDLFPGSGAVQHAWDEYNNAPRQLVMSAMTPPSDSTAGGGK